MRIHSLTLTGIGPFRSPQRIDFDAVTASGLFLIEGPTGAGKTTIIDAIVFALYGSLSGEDSDPGRLRSHLCSVEEPSEVVLEFSVAGVRHTITRNPAYERRKTRGEGTTTERARQTLVVHGNDTLAMRDAHEIGTYVAGRIGLTADQFRRLVVLPQGEFDTLLRASPTARYNTLAGLIDDGYMKRVQEDLLTQAKAAVDTRATAKRAVDDLATQLCGRAAEVLDDLPEPDHMTAVQVDEICERLGLATEVAQGEAAQAEALARAATTAAVAAIAERDRAHQATAARADLHRVTASLPAELRDESPAVWRDHLKLASARSARLTSFAEWEAGRESRAQERAALGSAIDEATSQVSDLQTRLDGLPQARQELEHLLRSAEATANRSVEYRDEVTRLTAITKTVALLDGAQAHLAATTERAQRLAAALTAAQADTIAARERRVDLLERRLVHSAAELAEHLQPGNPCPVCGSLDHPRAAAAPDAGLVRDSELEAAEADVVAAAETESAAQRAADEATADVVSAASQTDLLRGQLTEIDLTDLPAAIADAQAKADAAEAAGKESIQLRARLNELDAQAAQWVAERDAATATAATARATAKAHDDREAVELARLRELVGTESTAADHKAAADALCADLEAALAAQEAVAGLPLNGEMEHIAARADAAQAARSEADARNADTQRRLTTLTAARDAVVSLGGRWSTAYSAVESTMAATGAAIRLGDLVSARSNANIRKLTLQAYAVQQRFAAILAAASRHLEHMSSGKYSFALDEEASGGKHAGLGIDILDAWTGQLRDPSTLSGGETFYTSLSLALGLADIVREESGGVTLETLFVDEGFGSLDAETLTVVLDQLDALRARGRTVGVISHVAEMKEWVHDRIEVLPGAAPGEGSRIRQSGL